MVHHAVYCLMAAFASERMLVIDKADEVFGLEKHFLPVTQTCANEKIPPTPYDWPTATNNEQIVKFCPNRLHYNSIFLNNFFILAFFEFFWLLSECQVWYQQ